MATIAILDDDPMLRLLFQRILDRGGHDVRTYADGKAALAGLRSDPPDLLICDLHVPSMSGVDVARELRRDARTQAIRCILLTGSDPSHVRNTTDGLFDALLMKPVDIGELTAAVSDSLGLLEERAPE